MRQLPFISSLRRLGWRRLRCALLYALMLYLALDLLLFDSLDPVYRTTRELQYEAIDGGIRYTCWECERTPDGFALRRWADAITRDLEPVVAYLLTAAFRPVNRPLSRWKHDDISGQGRWTSVLQPPRAPPPSRTQGHGPAGGRRAP